MPYLYEKDDATRRITLTLVGEHDFGELMAALDRQAAEQGWDYQLLLDVTGRIGSPPSRAMLLTFAEHTERLSAMFGAPGPFAIVPRDDAGFGMSRMFELMSTARTARKVRVFRSSDDAQSWLDQIG